MSFAKTRGKKVTVEIENSISKYILNTEIFFEILKYWDSRTPCSVFAWVLATPWFRWMKKTSSLIEDKRKDKVHRVHTGITLFTLFHIPVELRQK